MSQLKKGIILADLQTPNHNLKLLKLWEEYLASEKWDYLIYLGDIMDMDAISHHALAAGELRQLEGLRLKDDYDFVSAMLRRHREIVGPECKIYYFLGNHCEWAEKLVDKIPGLEGLIELENNLPLKELNIDVIGYRKFLKLNNLYFIHGDLSRGYAPAFHAKRILETYNKTVIYGHHHSIQSATKPSPFGLKETHQAYCMPAMCDIWPAWNKNRPNTWVNGFGVFHLDGKTHSVYTVHAQGNKFIAPNGATYGGTK